MQVDPTRTVASGKVELGAFRCYPNVPYSFLDTHTHSNLHAIADIAQGMNPADGAVSEYQSIPLDKVEDFGVHVKSWVAVRSEPTRLQ